MRKTTIIILAIASLVFAACGTDSNLGDEVEVPTTTEQTTTESDFTAYSPSVQGMIETEIETKLRDLEAGTGEVTDVYVGCQPQDERILECNATVTVETTTGGYTCTGDIDGVYSAQIDPEAESYEWHNVSTDQDDEPICDGGY